MEVCVRRVGDFSGTVDENEKDHKLLGSHVQEIGSKGQTKQALNESYVVTGEDKESGNENQHRIFKAAPLSC